jgi:hypothetical protein
MMAPRIAFVWPLVLLIGCSGENQQDEPALTSSEAAAQPGGELQMLDEREFQKFTRKDDCLFYRSGGYSLPTAVLTATHLHFRIANQLVSVKQSGTCKGEICVGTQRFFNDQNYQARTMQIGGPSPDGTIDLGLGVHTSAGRTLLAEYGDLRCPNRSKAASTDVE